MATERFERAIERATGKSIGVIRDTSLTDRRIEIEQQRGRRIRLTNWFPFIGRGNVLNDRLVDHEEAERALKEALDE